jgi:hypothetical protein
MTIQSKLAERWLPIKGFGGFYEISDFGNVRSYARSGRQFLRNGSRGRCATPKNLKPKKNPCGYRIVSLGSGKGIAKTCLIHRLVLEAFIGPSPKGFVCAHLNGDPWDARLANLKWVTYAENDSHKDLHGTRFTKLTALSVKEIRSSQQIGTRELSLKYGVSMSTIYCILKKETWKRL